MKRTAIVCLTLLIGGTASAMTAAELLQDNSAFATGYVFGIVEYNVSVGTLEDDGFLKRRQCLLDTKANANTFLEMTKNFIRRNPNTLPEAASSAVLRTIIEMCGKT